jgi:hypothetical protein
MRVSTILTVVRRRLQTKHHELPSADYSGATGYFASAPGSHRERPLALTRAVYADARPKTSLRILRATVLSGVYCCRATTSSHTTPILLMGSVPHLLRGCVLDGTLRLRVGIGPSRSSNYMARSTKSRGVYDHSMAHTHWRVEGSSLSLDVSKGMDARTQLLA